MLLPENFIQSIQQAKGFDKEKFIAVHEQETQISSVRINQQKKQRLNATAEITSYINEQVLWCDQGYYLTERPSFTTDPLFHAGLYYVQEASSMFLWQVLKNTVDANAPLHVLDLCAAPGGKSTLLASYFSQALIVSNEVIKSRAGILVENTVKWGSENFVVTNNDPKDFQKLPGFFDVMVVDAPCSGSGLFRRDATAINEWSEDNVALCSQRQQRILADAWDCLKENGILIYSTCSYSQQEDEAIADWLMQEFEIESVAIPIQNEWGIVEVNAPVSKAFGYRFYPDKLKGEGFFIAVFRKLSGADAHLKSKPFPSVTATIKDAVKPWLKHAENFQFLQQQDRIIALPAAHANSITQLLNALYIRSAGILAGELKRNDFIPAHHLAMSNVLQDAVPQISVNKEQALAYLKRKDISVENAVKGWTVVEYGGLYLGWIKVLNNRINNYYPTEWRILKD